jgi:hypothetical protein
MSDLNTEKQRLLDLLVDGELSDRERNDLICWCEREPDGWRRCAVAFLEAQSWSKVLGEVHDTTRQSLEKIETVAVTKMVARPRSFWSVRQWGTMLATAASVVLAFTLGMWVRQSERDGQMPPLDQVNANVVSRGSSGTNASVFPVVENDGFGGDWLPTKPGAVPDEVRRAFERLGHEVQHERRLVPYRLDDGRRVVVPVDQVEVRPVENRSYQ